MRGYILDYTTKIEELLRQLNATGKGMHEKTDSIEDQLDSRIVKKLRFIATIRNKAVHENIVNVDLDKFTKNAQEVIDYLTDEYELKLNKDKQSEKKNEKQSNKSYDYTSTDWSDMSVMEKIATVATAGVLVVGAYFKIKDFFRN